MRIIYNDHEVIRQYKYLIDKLFFNPIDIKKDILFIDYHNLKYYSSDKTCRAMTTQIPKPCEIKWILPAYQKINSLHCIFGFTDPAGSEQAANYIIVPHYFLLANT